MEGPKQEHWSSNWGFLLAAAGSAIGLGNLWKFPYITGVNGGGAFVLVYLAAVLAVGLPLMICELAIGRATGMDPLGAFRKLAPKRSQLAELLGGVLLLAGVLLLLFGRYGLGGVLGLLGLVVLRFGWATLGFICGVLLPITIMTYYGVIGGWTFLYVFKSFTGELAMTTQQGTAAVLAPIASGAAEQQLWVIGSVIAFMLACGAVLWFGVKKGIERWSKLLMPAMFILLGVLIVRSLSLEGAQAGVKFFLAPDFSKLTGAGLMTALGHAFFTLSLAMGIMITYGSYMRKDQSIVRCSLQIIGLDTLASMMAGLAIFPAVFAMGGTPSRGPTLLYEVLPATFNRIPGELGWLWNGIFFIILSIAALTSAISIMETPISVLIRQFRMQRHWAVGLSFAAVTLLGVYCSLSMTGWDNLPTLGVLIDTLFQAKTTCLFDVLDNVSSNWILPINGMLIAVFVGWVWKTRNALREIRRGASPDLDTNWFVLLAGLRGEEGYGRTEQKILTPASIWGFFVRFLSPLGVLLAFLYIIGVLSL